MKKLFLILLVLAFSSPAFAGVYCQWTGTTRANCKSDGDAGFVLLPNGIYVSAKDYMEYGYYPLVVTYPTLTEDQKLGAEIETFNGSGYWICQRANDSSYYLYRTTCGSNCDLYGWFAVDYASAWPATLPTLNVDDYTLRISGSN